MQKEHIFIRTWTHCWSSLLCRRQVFSNPHSHPKRSFAARGNTLQPHPACLPLCEGLNRVPVEAEHKAAFSPQPQIPQALPQTGTELSNTPRLCWGTQVTGTSEQRVQPLLTTHNPPSEGAQSRMCHPRCYTQSSTAHHPQLLHYPVAGARLQDAWLKPSTAVKALTGVGVSGLSRTPPSKHSKRSEKICVWFISRSSGDIEKAQNQYLDCTSSSGEEGHIKQVAYNITMLLENYSIYEI